LRGAYIPAGSHKIEMKYTNEKLDLYKKIGYAATFLLLLIIFLLPIFSGKKKETNVK
jgi:hypothetical protein